MARSTKTPKASGSTISPTHVALLRGINVGGKNKVPMRELVAVLQGLGCSEVRTYIQSGNAVFRVEPTVAARLPARFASAFRKRFGFDAPLVLRSAKEIAKAAGRNNLAKTGCDCGVHSRARPEKNPQE